MTKFWLVLTGLVAIAVPALAQLSPPGAAPGFQAPITAPPPITPPASIGTSRGSGLVSGSAGSPRSVMIPGSPVPGMLLDNGNGTSSIMVPGGTTQVVPTPR
jgi:hypothetical protein